MSRIVVLCLVLPFGLLPTLVSCRGDLGRERYEPRTFLGYACPDDCERHKAGFAWAERRHVTAGSSCAVLGATEAQGCRAYIDEATSAEEAGYRWAGENEIEHQCDCDGAGQRFRAGCLRGISPPANTY
jgi:hypothetical protein